MHTYAGPGLSAPCVIFRVVEFYNDPTSRANRYYDDPFSLRFEHRSCRGARSLQWIANSAQCVDRIDTAAIASTAGAASLADRQSQLR